MSNLKVCFRATHPIITNWSDSWQEQGVAGLWNKSDQGCKFILTEADKPLIKLKAKSALKQLKQVRLKLKQELNKEISTKTLHFF